MLPGNDNLKEQDECNHIHLIPVDMSPDYNGNYTGLAEIENPEHYIVTHCIFLMFISLLMFPTWVHFKDHTNGFWTRLNVFGQFHLLWNYFAQVFPSFYWTLLYD